MIFLQRKLLLWWKPGRWVWGHYGYPGQDSDAKGKRASSEPLAHLETCFGEKKKKALKLNIQVSKWLCFHGWCLHVVEFGFFLPIVQFNLIKYPDYSFWVRHGGRSWRSREGKATYHSCGAYCLLEWSMGRHELETWVLTSAWRQMDMDLRFEGWVIC